MKLILWFIIAIVLSALVIKLYSSGNGIETDREQYRAITELAEGSAPVPPPAADGTSTEITEAGFEEKVGFTENSVGGIWIIIPDDAAAKHTAGTQSDLIYRRTPEEDAMRILRILMAYDMKIESAEGIASAK